jgi:type VI protein secretion system component Hcp
MRKPLRIAFLFLALAVARETIAQQSILVSVDGWPRLSKRDDGKLAANAFTWGVTAPAPASIGAGAGSGKVQAQDSVLLLPVGDAALLFARAAFRGEHLRTVLVEFSLSKADPKAPAPFAARLTEVFVTSVNLSKSGGDSGPGSAEVKLHAGRIELFTNNQQPNGSMQPGQRTGMDFSVMKPM